MRYQFTFAGHYSPEFIAMRGGVDIGIQIDAGSNSLTVEKKIDNAWYSYGAAVTVNGSGWRLSHNIDYAAPQRFRIKCGTFATGPVYADIGGDFLAAEVTSLNPPSTENYRVTDAGDDRITHSDDYRILEDA
jgi:hypothetical protein